MDKDVDAIEVADTPAIIDDPTADDAPRSCSECPRFLRPLLLMLFASLLEEGGDGWWRNRPKEKDVWLGAK